MSAGPQILLLSDFNVQNFVAALKKNIPGSRISQNPFNQLHAVLMDPEHDVWNKQYDLVVCWASVTAIAPSFPAPDAVQQLDSFIGLLKASPVSSAHFLVVEFVPENKFYGFGQQDELHHMAEMNLALRKAFTSPRHAVLSPLPWLFSGEAPLYSPKLWYLSKTPFHREIFFRAAGTVRSYLDGWKGGVRKLLVLDLDDTLWGGIVGDDGWENLRLGGHDGEGEAYADFQKKIHQLKQRGVILAVVSKNDEAVALHAFRTHPEMVLKEHDISAWKINWDDKAQNISAVAEELNLGLDSVVFLDDNPAERGRIRAALPSVYVPDMPHDKMLYPQFLDSLDVFNFSTFTEEDRNRSELYRQEKLRSEEQEKFMDMDTWLASLNITLTISPLRKDTVARAAQLLNKTNQMNLRTRRMSEDELWSWAGRKENLFRTVNVSDKFGNAGLTGLVSFSINNDVAFVEDFVLSCRVMGRKVEETMLGFLVREAAALGLKKLEAHLISTEKNRPCREFFGRSGWKENGDGVFVFSLPGAYPVLSYITCNIVA